MTGHRSHADALVERYAAGRSIRELERAHGLTPGALANHLKPSVRGGFPRLEILERFAEVLGAPLKEVTAAFAKDARLELFDTEPLSPDTEQLVNLYHQLDPTRQDLARATLRAILDQQHAEHPET